MKTILSSDSQHREPTPTLINDRRMKSALLRALADPESARILAATATGPRSAQEIVKSEELPQSTTYRRLHELEEEGLVVVAKTVLKPDGKTYQMYKATFCEVRVAFRGRELVVEGEPNTDVVERAFRLFHSLKEGP